MNFISFFIRYLLNIDDYFSEKMFLFIFIFLGLFFQLKYLMNREVLDLDFRVLRIEFIYYVQKYENQYVWLYMY